MEYQIYRYITSSFEDHSWTRALFVVTMSNLVISGDGLALALALGYTLEYFNVEFSPVVLTIGCVFMMSAVFIAYMDKFMDRMDERDRIWDTLGGTA
jgi:hypothetical protein